MNAKQILEAALSLCTDLGYTVPSANSVWYRRVGIRQGQIFSKVASTHPDYFGASATVALVAGAYSLASLNPRAERITDVRVANSGSSGLVKDDRVNLVLLEDIDAMLAPRAVIRDQVLRGIGTDLTGVQTVTIHYAKRPISSSDVTPTTEMELPEQFQDLLVLDLARQMIRKVLDVEPGRRDGWIDLLSSQEKELLGTLDEHVRYFVYGEQRRFRPPSAPVPGGDNA